MRILGKVISVLYSIVFVAVLFSLSALICASNLLKGDFYTEVLESVELEEISAKDLGLVDDDDPEGQDKNLQEVLVEKISDAGIDKEVADAILKNKEIKKVVGDVIGQVINYKLADGEAPKVTETQVKSILNNEDVKKMFDGELSNEDISEMTEMFNEFLKDFASDGGTNGD